MASIGVAAAEEIGENRPARVRMPITCMDRMAELFVVQELGMDVETYRAPGLEKTEQVTRIEAVLIENPVDLACVSCELARLEPL